MNASADLIRDVLHVSPSPIVDAVALEAWIREEIETTLTVLRRGAPDFSALVIVGSPSGVHVGRVDSALTTPARRSIVLDEILPAVAWHFGAVALALVSIAWESFGPEHRAQQIERVIRGDFTGAAALITVASVASAVACRIALDGPARAPDLGPARPIEGAYPEAMQRALALSAKL